MPTMTNQWQDKAKRALSMAPFPTATPEWSARLALCQKLKDTNRAKVSDFRQKWIDALREDAATLITHTFFVRGVEVRS